MTPTLRERVARLLAHIERESCAGGCPSYNLVREALAAGEGACDRWGIEGTVTERRCPCGARLYHGGLPGGPDVAGWLKDKCTTKDWPCDEHHLKRGTACWPCALAADWQRTHAGGEGAK